MSVRRAADAGISPWWGVVFFVPIANYVGMIVFSILPSNEGKGWALPPGFTYRRSPEQPKTELAPPDIGPGVRSARIGVLASTFIGIAMIGISVYSMQLYGAALFRGITFLMGSTTSFGYSLLAGR